MKIFASFLVLVSCVFANDSVEDIYREAFDLRVSYQGEKSEEEVLLDFYNEKLEGIDLEILKENPELVFRRGAAHRELLSYTDFDSEEEELSRYAEILRDMQFVLDHTESRTRLHAAAQLKFDLCKVMLSQESTFDQWSESILRKWAVDPSTTGKALRYDVYDQISMNPKVRESFFDYVLISEDDADICLGYIQPDQIQMIGVESDEYGAFLVYEIKYHRTPYSSVHITAGI